jgi:hypothetical protein
VLENTKKFQIEKIKLQRKIIENIKEIRKTIN